MKWHDNGHILELGALMGSTEDGAAVPLRSISASEFKATCLRLMDEVAETGIELVITKHGRPVSRLSPYRERPKSLFGIDRGRFELAGDIDEPVGVVWEAEQGLVDGG